MLNKRPQINSLEDHYGSHPNPGHAQIERLTESKKFDTKLLSLKKELIAEGIPCTFSMYSILTFKIISPIDRLEILVMTKSVSDIDIILTSPLLPFTIVFENCASGIELARRLRTSKMILDAYKVQRSVDLEFADNETFFETNLTAFPGSHL